jgi:tryptophan halogenase
MSIRSVVVAGSGPIAWSAASALRRAFEHLQLDVGVVSTGATRDVRIGRWTLPSQRGMHGLLGIAESHLVQQTGATFKLASEHVGWQGEGSRFLHAHGEIGVDLGGTPFYKFIQRETLAGRPEKPEWYSLAAAAANLGRFARPVGDGKSLTASFTYGFHFEEAALTQYLRTHALRLGVREAAAPFADVVMDETGAISGLRLTDGSTVQAQYFIDCSGPEARLLGSIGPPGREDWSQWLPCDRMWSALAPAAANAPAATRIVAEEAGWSWRAPLAGASMVGHVYSSRFADDDTGRANLQRFEPAQSQPVLTHFSAGRRREFWRRNCVALGAAAVELEPLVGADLHLAQIGLALFIELFPLRRESNVEAAEYNRVMAQSADALRDFTVAHYRAGAPRPGEFWTATRAAMLPALLAEKLDLYGASGRISLLDHETFEETDWAWLLMGAGCVPTTMELQILLRLAKLSVPEVHAMRTQIQQLAASMPPHMEFVRRQATIAARSAH